MKKIVSLLIIILIVTAFNGTAAKERGFYVTQITCNGAQALAACATGYHMASLWEIFDVSNLRYNTKLGLTQDDSGGGPPASSSSQGWIRTGGPSSTSSIAGMGNCEGWTMGDQFHLGTIVHLESDWARLIASSVPASPWRAQSPPCSFATHVWCVQD